MASSSASSEPAEREPIPQSPPWPDLSGPDYIHAVTRVLAAGKLTEGPEVRLLEEEFAESIGGSRFVRGVSGGTQAIEVLLRALDIGPGDEVIVPAFTFAGTALPVLNVGATLRFADINPRTFNIDADSVSALLSRRTRAVIAVHLHGLPVNMYSLERLPVLVIEDAAQAYGATAEGKRAGSMATHAAFSLNRTKTVFGGEGGLACSLSADVAERIESIRRFGEPPPTGAPAERWRNGEDVLRRWGHNYKLPELSAAVARVSLRQLDTRLKWARVNAYLLAQACMDSGLLIPPYVPPGYDSAWHKFRVRPAADAPPREVLMAGLRRAGVPCCLWQTTALPDHPFFEHALGRQDLLEAPETPAARHVAASTFILGDEDRPLCSLPHPVSSAWAERIANLKEYI